MKTLSHQACVWVYAYADIHDASTRLYGYIHQIELKMSRADVSAGKGHAVRGSFGCWFDQCGARIDCDHFQWKLAVPSGPLVALLPDKQCRQRHCGDEWRYTLDLRWTSSAAAQRECR